MYIYFLKKTEMRLRHQNKTSTASTPKVCVMLKYPSCLLFRVLLVLLEPPASPDQEEDLDPKVPRDLLDREVLL